MDGLDTFVVAEFLSAVREEIQLTIREVGVLVLFENTLSRNALRLAIIKHVFTWKLHCRSDVIQSVGRCIPLRIRKTATTRVNKSSRLFLRFTNCAHMLTCVSVACNYKE